MAKQKSVALAKVVVAAWYAAMVEAGIDSQQIAGYAIANADLSLQDERWDEADEWYAMAKQVRMDRAATLLTGN